MTQPGHDAAGAAPRRGRLRRWWPRRGGSEPAGREGSTERERRVPRKQRPPREPRLRVPRSTASRRWLFWVVLGVVAAGLYAIEVPLAVSLYAVPVQIVFVVVAAHVGALPLAVWRPREASVVSVAAVVILMLISSGGSATTPWPWAVTPLITQALTLAVIAWKDTWWWALAVWAGSCAASVLAALALWSHRPLGASTTNIVVFANIAVFTIAAAIVVRQLQRTRAQLVTERSTSEAERTRRQVLDERARIARELHDVVAHGMSILNVQATSAPYRHPGLSEEVVAEFEQIAAQTRTTLGEMRRLLGVLRADEVDDVPGLAGGAGGAGGASGSSGSSGASSASTRPQRTAELAPQPGLGELPALIEQARGAGAEILYQPGDAFVRAVDDVVALAAYRIVQEALSNALRHAPGAPVTVTASRDSRMLEVAVVNGPPRASARRETGQVEGAGFGLRGMRERAVAVGGSVDYGVTDDGGWRVDAVLPAHPGGAS